MVKNRIVRLNSLLKEVISEVIHRDVRNPLVNQFVTVTSVDITKDLQHAKVHISVIGSQEEKDQTIRALQSAAGFIADTILQKSCHALFSRADIQIGFKCRPAVQN